MTPSHYAARRGENSVRRAGKLDRAGHYVEPVYQFTTCSRLPAKIRRDNVKISGARIMKFGNAFLIYILAAGPAFAMDDPLCKVVNSKWELFGDHFAGSIDYYISGPANRCYEVGTGISFNGAPLGTKSVHERAYRATAYGLGAIHIRLKDGGQPFMVCVSGNITNLVPLCGRLGFDCSF